MTREFTFVLSLDRILDEDQVDALFGCSPVDMVAAEPGWLSWSGRRAGPSDPDAG